MTAASTTTLPPSVETLRSLMDDQAEHIGQQRERIRELEAEVAAHSAKTMTLVANHAALTDRLRDALKLATDFRIESFGQRSEGMGPYKALVWFPGNITPIERQLRARAVLSGHENRPPDELEADDYEDWRDY